MNHSRTDFFSGPCALQLSAILLLALPMVSRAQDTPGVARLRALTDQLTETGRGIKGTSRSELRRSNSSMLRERGDLLYDLCAENPSQAIELSFQPDVADRLRAVFPEVSDKIESHASLESPIIVFVAENRRAGTSRTSVQMENSQGKLDVYFAGNEPEGVKSGDVLRIHGIRMRNRIAAIDAKVVNAATGVLACSPTGDQKTAALLVNFPGTPPPSLSTDTLRSVFFSSTLRSVDSYWRENSYNQASASGDAFGPYTLDRAYSCDETGPMWTAAIQAADASLDFRAYSRYFLVFPTIPNCWFTGMGTVGCGTWNSPAHGAFTGSVAWEPSYAMDSQDAGVSLSVHEGGHGLGLAHSRSKSFSGEALGPLATPGVTLEYGDPYASMAYSPGQYAAPHKALLGWLAPESGYHTVETTGVFTIAPIETTATGMKALKVRRGTGNNAWLWIEYRQPSGSSDTLLQGVSFSGAVVHYEDSTTLNYSDLLDFTPQTSTASDAPLASWSDPYSDLTLLVLSATPSGLTIGVQYGPQSGCSLVIPSVSLATSAAAAPPAQTIDYSVVVRNNDTAACSSPRTFILSSPQPNGWGTAFSSSSVTLAPQQSASVTLTKSVPAGTPTGTQTVTAIAADNTNSGSGTATVIVAGPSNPQPVSVTPSGGSGNPIVFSFVFTDPDGFAQILSAAILFNTTVSFPNACHIIYEPGNNRFFLANDGETGYLGPVVLGSFQTVENSQCRLSGAGSSAVGSGTTLTLNLAMAFKASYLGPTNVYMEAQNYFVQGAWQQMGTWTITAPQAPGTPSAPSPAPGATGVPVNPILLWTPGAGATWYDVYFGTSPSPPFAVSTPVLNFSPGVLASGATYYWKVVATSAAGSTASPLWSFTTLVVPDFSLTVTPPNQSVKPGGSASYTAAITASNGFTGSVSLAATGLPAGVTASFNPVSVAGGSGQAAITISTSPGTPAGAYALSVSGVSGPLSHSASLGIVVQAPTTLSLAAPGGPFTYGQPVSLKATISPNAASGVIQFMDGSNPLGTATLSAGTATFTVSSPSVGNHQFKASYAGNGVYLPSVAGLSVFIGKATPSVTLKSSLNPAIRGQSVTFTATLLPSAATGSVTFLDEQVGGNTNVPTVLGTVAIVNGSAALSVASLSIGTHLIKAAYGGDVCCAANLSNLLTETVKPPPPGAPRNLTATAVSSTHIKLSWSAGSPAGATYNVYAGSTSGFTPSPSNRVGTGILATSYSNAGLLPSSTHYYVVTAQNSGGESAPSNQASATTHAAVSGTSITSQAASGARSLSSPPD